VGRGLLWALALGLAALGMAGNPMLLVYPLGLVVHLTRRGWQRLVRGWPLFLAFVGSGLVFGLLTEVFAVLNNRSLPPEQRILLSPDPFRDLVYGVFYYLFFVAAWYLLLRLAAYSKREVFVLSGIFGILTEETGQVFLRVFTVPGIGVLYALVVATVYGIFPALAYTVSEEKLPVGRSQPALVRYPAAAVVLFLEWAVYGLAVLPLLKKVLE